MCEWLNLLEALCGMDAIGSLVPLALHLVRELGKSGTVQLGRALIDSASVRAVFWGATRVRTRRTVQKLCANAIS